MRPMPVLKAGFRSTISVNNHWQRALRGIARGGGVNQLADAHVDVDVDVAPSRTGYMPRTFGRSRSRPN